MFYLSCTVGALGDNFGWSVAGIGDVDHDGRPDMLVGGYHADPCGYNSGRIAVFSGASGSQMLSFEGTCEGEEFGCSVAGLGDLNQDGYPDIVVGARYNDSTDIDAGAARVYYLGDADADGIAYACDNCPTVSNSTQVDSDGDDVGNACDNCLDVPNPEQTDADSNGVGDACDLNCGDADGSGVLDIADALYLIAYIVSDGSPPEPYLSADVDCNGRINIADAVYLIGYMYGGGQQPCGECGESE